MRATQKKMMSLPVTSTEEGRNTSRSFVFSGQPSEEKGTRAEENHVSRTSGSRRRDFCLAICRAAFSLRATKILPCSSYHAGIWWPHQSWREMHQSWMFSSHWLYVVAEYSVTNLTSPLATARSPACARLSIFTDHWSVSIGSTISSVRSERGMRSL